MFFEDEKPALLQQIDAEFEKVNWVVNHFISNSAMLAVKNLQQQNTGWQVKNSLEAYEVILIVIVYY